MSQRINNEDVPILKFVVESLGTEVKVRTYDMTVEAYLGGIYLQHLKFKGNILSYDEDADLFMVKSFCPDFFVIFLFWLAGVI